MNKCSDCGWMGLDGALVLNNMDTGYACPGCGSDDVWGHQVPRGYLIVWDDG
jgi:predicted RNA-binding Zn-ribbon protein involved in translation (DUF1610 family)